MNHCTLTYASGIVWFLVSMSAGYAQSWPDDMFDSIKHDFGYVPWGYLSKRVVITNRTDQPVHIFDITRGGQSVSVAKMDKHWIQAGDSVCVELVLQPLNTRYRRSEVLSVQFDHPRVGKSTLRFDWFTRGDLVFDPPQIQFGPVKKGTAVERLVNIEYAGDLNWKIRTATCSNPSVDVQIKEKRRELTKQGFARVSYELCANLSPDAPVGEITGPIVVEVNDSYNRTVEVLVEGTVQAEDVAVYPSELDLGKIGALDRGLLQGTRAIAGRVVVRGVRPFRIVSIEGKEGPFTVEMPTEDKTAVSGRLFASRGKVGVFGAAEGLAPNQGDRPAGPKHAYVLTIEQKPHWQKGRITQEFKIKTDVGQAERLDLTVSAER